MCYSSVNLKTFISSYLHLTKGKGHNQSDAGMFLRHACKL